METAFCDKCNEEHPINMFYKCNNKSLLATGEYKIYTVLRCKKHVNKQQKEHNDKNKEQILVKKREYYNKNKSIVSEKAKIYREKNKEKIKENKKQYGIKNKEQISQKKKSIEKTFDGFLTKIICRCKYNDEIKNFKCDLDKDYIINLKELQNNLCYFCKNELIYERDSKQLNQASIDRIDNNLGHIKGNVHLTCIFCNHAKNINTNKTYKSFIDWLIGKEVINKENYKTDNRYLSKLCDSSKYYDKKKFNENDANKIISKNEIQELIVEQNNKCSITGLPLIPCLTNYFPLKPSVDRLDNKKGHTKDNCQIVCLAIQHGKLTHDTNKVIEYIESIRKNINLINANNL